MGHSVDCPGTRYLIESRQSVPPGGVPFLLGGGGGGDGERLGGGGGVRGGV